MHASTQCDALAAESALRPDEREAEFRLPAQMVVAGTSKAATRARGELMAARRAIVDGGIGSRSVGVTGTTDTAPARNNHTAGRRT